MIGISLKCFSAIDWAETQGPINHSAKNDITDKKYKN
jgi:hypothetical protein